MRKLTGAFIAIISVVGGMGAAPAQDGRPTMNEQMLAFQNATTCARLRDFRRDFGRFPFPARVTAREQELGCGASAGTQPNAPVRPTQPTRPTQPAPNPGPRRNPSTPPSTQGTTPVVQPPAPESCRWTTDAFQCRNASGQYGATPTLFVNRNTVRLAEQDDPVALSQLAHFYDQSAPPTRNQRLARETAQKCSGRHVFCAGMLANYYFDGLGGLERSNLLGVLWVERTANLGSGSHMKTMGSYYETGGGRGVTINLPKALEWYQKAKNAGVDTTAELTRVQGLIARTVAAPLRPTRPVAPSAGTASAGMASTITASTAPGTSFRDCSNCPEMIVIKPGSFLMGSASNDPLANYNEQPQGTVSIARAFAVGVYEVTFEEWDRCVAAGSCYRPSETSGGRGRQPVVKVSPADVEVYLAWLSRTSTKTYRLLSESEWEYAARAGATGQYSLGQGQTVVQPRLNVQSAASAPRAVGGFSPNAFGLFDMHGNAQELVADCYVAGYSNAPSDGSARRGTNCTTRVARGGAWSDTNPTALRLARRQPTTGRDAQTGFRVARSL